jgi:MFS family permease
MTPLSPISLHGYHRWVKRVLADVTPLRRHRDLRKLLAGQWLSALGSQATVVAVAYQAYRMTGSTLVVGLVSLCQLGPLLAGTLWGGAVADTMDRRRLLLITVAVLIAASAGLAVNAALSRPQLWPLFVLSAVTAGFQGVQAATERAATPMVVPLAELPATLALQQIVFQVAVIAGPAAAGLLIGAVGLDVVFGLDAVVLALTWVVSASLPSLVPTIPEGGSRRAGLASIAEGLRYLRTQRLLAAIYLVDLDAMIFGMPRAVFPALALSVFGGGAATLGLLYAAPGVGALVGAVFTGWVGRVQHQGRAVILAVAGWGAAIAAFGFVQVLWVGLVLLALAGAADVVSAVFRGSILQTTVPEHLQGRLSGTYIAVVTGGPRLGDAEAGVAASLGGPQFAVWSGGLACILGLGVVAWRVPQLWRQRAGSTSHQPAAPNSADAPGSSCPPGAAASPCSPG